LMRALRSETAIDEATFTGYADDMLQEAMNESYSVPDTTNLITLCNNFGVMGVAVDVTGTMPEESNIALFVSAFVQEGITNAVRHGFATKVCVCCEENAQDFALSIENEGLAPPGEIVIGGGIAELRRRLSLLGGELEITTQPKFRLMATIHKATGGERE